MPKSNKKLAKEIGQRIAQRRNELGWTQDELAEHSGLSQQYLACVERGAKGLGYDSTIKLSHALDRSTDYILMGTMTKQESDLVVQMLALMNEEQRTAAIAVIRSILIACGYIPPEDQLRK